MPQIPTSGPNSPGNPPRQPGQPKRIPTQRKRVPKSNKTFLTVLLIVGGTLLIASLVAALLFIFSDRHNKITLPNNDTEEKVVREDDMVSIDQEPDAMKLYIPKGSYYARGTLSDLPFSIDFTVSPDGRISGVFWNILYDVKLQVNGTVDDVGNLSLDLGSGSSLSHMNLTPDGRSFSFSGSWGNSRKPVSLNVLHGERDLALPPQSGTKFSISGGGMITHGHIVKSGGDYWLTFDNQPYVNRMPCRYDNGIFHIFDPWSHKQLAYFHDSTFEEEVANVYTCTLYICNGNEFEITFD